MPILSPDAIDRFWSYVQKGPDCWEWKAGRTGSGYGAFAINRRPALAHRISFELANGPIPEGMQVCHRCDNRACVRPDHLFLGSQKDNMVDMIGKGRGVLNQPMTSKHLARMPRGERHHKAKLSDTDVLEIRRRAKLGVSAAQLGREYGVSTAGIAYILRGEHWKHLLPHE